MADYLNCGFTTLADASKTSVISRQDRIRERELYRFYWPDNAPVDSDSHSPPLSPPHGYDVAASSPITNNDVTLGALAQLVAHRLGVHRCMINVIGRETQYTLVESTKTLNLVNQKTSELVGDEAWMGSGGRIHKSVSLCENVVALPTEVVQHPFLIVSDLSKDTRFKSRPYVQGHPHYKFYAGTPLKTARGVVIGALCVFAHESRDISETEKSYMATIAETIMQYLEMRRAAAERDKVTRMSRGLAAFVEGKESQYVVPPEPKEIQDALATPIAPINTLPTSDTASAAQPDPESEDGSQKITTDDKIDTPQLASRETKEHQNANSGPPKNSSEKSKTAIEEQFQATLSRAAGLLDEALGLKAGGGVVFYDTVARSGASSSDLSSPSSPTGDEHADDWEAFSDEAPTPGLFEGMQDEELAAPILGSSISASYSVENPQITYRRFASRMISKLIKRYPAGRTWEFDERGVIPSDHDGVLANDSRARQYAAEMEVRRRLEAEYLTIIFPGVKSLIFVPLWDANLARHYAGCFAWTTDTISRFSTEVEFSFVTAFGNSISAEISRLATIDADQRKSDFIGSVSHELRSPLHGVLASAEFLADTKLDSFQSTLVGTIDSCGRTLLDTINHVLDFSKINSLRRTWKKSTTKNQRNSAVAGGKEQRALQSSGIMSILGATDLAAITEEVVDSVYAGKIYAKAFSPADITDVGASGVQRRDSEQPRWQDSSKQGVQVLLDIAPGDYQFMTQPGAIRRIVMNIFGNALKYTEQGSIMVRLSQESTTKDHEIKNTVTITVKDTGKGISPGYLRTRLYTPFAQENDLAPGTGLGLSIVRNIVTMLRGDISIRSKVGRGTEVRICLPNLMRASQNTHVPGQDIPRSIQTDFDFVKKRHPNIEVGLYGFESDPSHISHEVGRILRQYLQEWCGVTSVVRLERGVSPDVIVVDERLLDQLEHSGLVGPDDCIIALCRNPAPVQLPQGASSRHYFLLKPFGPYKLARTVRKCIERSRPGLNGRPLSFAAASLPEKPDSLLQSGTTAASMNNPEMPLTTALESGRQGLTSFSTLLGEVHSQVLVDKHTAYRNSSSLPKQSIAKDFEDTDSNFCDPPTTMAGPPGRAITASNLANTLRIPQILVVDDNKTNLMLLQTFLKKRGLQSDSASDGGMAVRAATSSKYDIIFMDISMPVMNGFEATREIRRQEENTRKQFRRNSIGTPLKSRPTSRVWQQDAFTMTPTSSQQRHGNPQQTQAQGTMAVSTTAATGLGGLEIVPNKPATPPVSPEEEVTSDTAAASAPAAPVATALKENGSAACSRLLKPAIIIALTGLASHRDQNEAFSSGVDLYMTKPVSFKEVGKLLDAWTVDGDLRTADA